MKHPTQQTGLTPDAQREGYIARNRRWLQPLAAGLMFAASAALPQPFGGQLPGWAYALGGALCAFAIGFGARMTDTSSAKAVRWVSSVLALAMAGFVLVRVLAA